MNWMSRMNVEVRRIVAFLCLLAAIVFILDRSVSHVLNILNEKDHGGKHGGRIQRVLRGTVKPSLLLLGNSRMVHGVDPAGFDYPAYNLGHEGYQIVWLDGVLGLLEENGRLPQAVLVELNPEVFLADSTEDISRLQDMRFLRILWHPGNWVDRNKSQWPLKERVKFFSTLYPFNGQLLYLLSDLRSSQQSLESTNGFEPVPWELGDEERVERIARKNEMLSHSCTMLLSQKNLRLLSDIVVRLHQRGVFVAAFSAPEYADNGSSAPIFMAVDRVLKPLGVPYLHFDSVPEWPEDIHLFKDPGHVNAEGAQKLTRILAKWLKSYLDARFDRDIPVRPASPSGKP